MQRIIAIGCPGAGKSTFARRLRDASGLPLHYLDMIWHRPDKTNISPREFDVHLAQIMAQEAWIIDGNYLRTLEMRLQDCDVVFFLDYSLETCLQGAQARIGVPREDMPWIETEFDPEFRQWIETFARDQRPRIYELLADYKGKLMIFKNRQESELWLANIENGKERV